MKGTWDGERDPLAALRAGRSGPFEAFVVSETPRLLAFFMRLGASRAEAEDLVQELFLKLFQQASSYRSQGRFVPFVFRVARNGWIDRVRQVARRGARHDLGSQPGAGEGAAERPSPLGWLVSREPDPATSAGRREELAALRRAWARLPEHHRLVFELGVLQERSYPEIAEILDVPIGTVKSRMFYALRKLREVGSEPRPSEVPE